MIVPFLDDLLITPPIIKSDVTFFLDLCVERYQSKKSMQYQSFTLVTIDSEVWTVESVYDFLLWYILSILSVPVV